MARILKGIDLSCVSPASTAICSSTTDPHNPSTIRHRHSTSSSNPPRPLHRRLNTYLQDQYRNLATNLPVPGPPTTTTTTPKCISDDPFTPRRTQQKTALFSSSSTAAANTNRRNDDNILAMRRKSTSSSIATHHRGTTTTTTDALIGRGRRCSSSRYYLLLRDNNFDKHVDDNPLAIIPCEPIADTSSALVVSQPLVKSSNYSQDHSTPTTTDPIPRMRKLKDENRAVVTSQTSIRQKGKNQVVILKVSLHCKGCEGKLKKHLSKMQGVRSFSIDLEMKKVTVTLEGNMTPAHLLANISRVKYAEFWTSSTSTTCSSLSPSSSSSTTSTKSEFSTNH